MRPNLLVVPWTFGLGLMAAIFAFGHISGGHFNPAVTIAMVLDKRTTPMDAVGYILSQIIGAVFAAIIVAVAVSQQAVTDGITAPGEGITDIGAVIIEMVATAGFLAVILAATKRATALAALGHPTDAGRHPLRRSPRSAAPPSTRPGRSGPAIVGGDLSHIWIYIVGPIVGGVIGWLAWRLIDGGAETYPAEQPGAEVAAA